MRLLIIQPSHYRSPSDRTLHKVRKRTLVSLTLPYLAALTPPDFEISLVDEQITDVDFAAPADLVAIATWTLNSLRAYEIAEGFRKRGIPVIMGGPHTSFHADEAAAHCDAVGIGEGEGIWKVMLEDAAKGRLKKVYRAEGPHDLKHLPFPRYDLLDLRNYGHFKTFSVQSSRGCPFKCEFCSERFYLGECYRYRPVEEVVDEIKRSGARNILFADSNFAGKLEHTMEIMEALIPLKLRWSTLWSVYLCNNRKFLDLAVRSGVLHVNIGMESIDSRTLAGMNKKVNRIDQYQEALENLRRRDISYSLNFIFGWDTEGPEVFGHTMSFLQKHKVPVAYFNILTPHKGTPLYDSMLAQERIINIDDISRWPGIICYIKPLYCSPEELERSVKSMYDEFYKYSSMLSRLPLPFTKSRIASWAVNLSERRVARSGTAVEDFDNY